MGDLRPWAARRSRGRPQDLAWQLSAASLARPWETKPSGSGRGSWETWRRGRGLGCPWETELGRGSQAAAVGNLRLGYGGFSQVSTGCRGYPGHCWPKQVSHGGPGCLRNPADPSGLRAGPHVRFPTLVRAAAGSLPGPGPDSRGKPDVAAIPSCWATCEKHTQAWAPAPVGNLRRGPWPGVRGGPLEQPWETTVGTTEPAPAQPVATWPQGLLGDLITVVGGQSSWCLRLRLQDSRSQETDGGQGLRTARRCQRVPHVGLGENAVNSNKKFTGAPVPAYQRPACQQVYALVRTGRHVQAAGSPAEPACAACAARQRARRVRTRSVASRRTNERAVP